MGIWTALEPALGIANACLPVLQPVISKLAGLPVKALSRAKGSSKGSSKGEVDKQKLWTGESYRISSRNGASGQKNMHRFHSQPYETTDGTVAQFVPKGSDDGSDVDLELQRPKGLYQPGFIKVTKDYTVHSTN